LGFEMYSRTRLRICLSISLGWSPTGIFYNKNEGELASKRKTTTTARGTHLCEPWQIDQGEVEHIGAAYLQMYRQLRDTLVLAGDAIRLLLDLAPDLVEIDEALVEVEELAPFSAVAGGRVDQLENEWSARHDALAAREEIAPDDADSGVIDYFFSMLDDADGGMVVVH
jgi:hypothetical protein